MAKLKISEALRVGKEVSDVPQSFVDPSKTASKFQEAREAGSAAAGLMDDIEAIQANPVAFGIATAIGAQIETLREYAGATIDFDLYDRDGNQIFPQAPEAVEEPVG